MLRLGEFELHSLSDGLFRLDGGAMFGVVPKPLWSRRATADDRNRIPLAMRPLLARSASHTVLIDAGVGDKLSERERDIYAIDQQPTLQDSLASIGLTPEDVDVVIAATVRDRLSRSRKLGQGRLPDPPFSCLSSMVTRRPGSG